MRGSFTGAYRDKPGLLETRQQRHDLHGRSGGDEPAHAGRSSCASSRAARSSASAPSAPQARVNVRVIAATNRNLTERIASKDFREDLYYRLNVIHLTVPPLRDRREDVPELLDHFIAHYSERHSLPAPAARAEALELRWWATAGRGTCAS